MKRFLIVLASLVVLLLPSMVFASGSGEGGGSEFAVGVVLPTNPPSSPRSRRNT
jgi:hypothetical protein